MDRNREANKRRQTIEELISGRLFEIQQELIIC
jgi:hypothetical protein